jgi:hypothetical protein
MKKVFAAVSVVGALVVMGFIGGCASEKPQSNMWQVYAGCNAKQCEMWTSECEAACLNAKTNATQCTNQCKVSEDDCRTKCTG